MTTLGVTGGIGSGKTMACRMFERLGAQVFHADEEAKRLMTEHAGLRADLREAFGAESFNPDGTLNRSYLSETIFADEKKVQRINALVHPRVFDAFQARKEAAEAAGLPLLVHEAALIFEAGGEKHLDAVAVVDAPEALRLRRVMARDNVDADAVRARMAHQLPAAEKRRRADYVIDNSGSEEDLRAEVERVFQAVTVPPAS